MKENILLLSTYIDNVNYLLDQVQGFIGQFNNLITTHNINIVTDVYGSMEIDFPSNMTDVQVLDIRDRVGVIDRLINTQGGEAKLSLQKGLDIYHKIKNINPEYKSEILNQLSRFEQLNKSYSH